MANSCSGQRSSRSQPATGGNSRGNNYSSAKPYTPRERGLKAEVWGKDGNRQQFQFYLSWIHTHTVKHFPPFCISVHRWKRYWGSTYKKNYEYSNYSKCINQLNPPSFKQRLKLTFIKQAEATEEKAWWSTIFKRCYHPKENLWSRTLHAGGTRWVSYREIPEDTQNMPESRQTIFPQDAKCQFELWKLKLTMHWLLLYREQSVLLGEKWAGWLNCRITETERMETPEGQCLKWQVWNSSSLSQYLFFPSVRYMESCTCCTTKNAPK